MPEILTSIRGSQQSPECIAWSDPLYQQGVPLLPPRPAVPEPEIHWCGGRKPSSDFTFTGHGFTDGAMTGGSPKVARRAGWAAVLVTDDGAVIAGLYGPWPDPFPTAFRAELRAVVQMLELALPPLKIWVDNKSVVDGWAKGRTWCCSSARPAADLWRRFWDLIEDIGTQGLDIQKCKGHATDAGIEAGRSTAFLRAGNDHADHFAGRGVQVAAHHSPADRDLERDREARRWYDWLFTFCAHWSNDTQARPTSIQRPQE
jgi:ribonuclease HI